MTTLGIRTPDYQTVAQSLSAFEEPTIATQHRYTVRDFLMVIFKYKGLVLFAFLGTVLGTLTWLWLRSETYETSAKVVIKFTREVEDPSTALSPSTTKVLPATKPDINTEAELIKSYALVEEVVTMMGLDRPRVEVPPAALLPRVKYELRRSYHWAQNVLDSIQVSIGLKEPLTAKEKAIVELIRGLKVESVKDSSVVKVALSSPIKQGAGSILNNLIELYRKRRLSVGVISGKVDFFDAQAKSAQEQLHASEEQLHDLKGRFNISSMPEQTSLVLKSLAEADQTVQETSDLVSGAEAKAALLRDQLKSVPATSVSSEMESRNQQLEQLLEKKVDLQLQKQALLAKYDEKNVFVQDVDEQIQRITQLLADTDRTVPQSRTTSENVNYLALQKELFATNQFLASARARLDGQRKTLWHYKTQLGQLRQAEVLFNQLSRDVTLNDETYRLDQRNAVEARASEALDSHGVSSIEVVDPAVDPILASGIRKSYLAGGAVALGLMLAIGLAFLFDGMDNSVENADDLEASLGRPMWGAVPLALPSKNVDRLPPGEDFAAIAAKLTATALGPVTHVFVVQGASAGAGATTVTMGTAGALAAGFGRKTLIVAPRSGPMIDELAARAASTRDVQLANGTARLSEITPNLGVLTCATYGPDLMRLSTDDIISALGPALDYEFVLVDVAESLAPYLRAQLSRGCEGVIVVAAWQETRGEVLRRLMEDARNDGIRVLAGVLNKRRFLIPEPIYRLL